MLEDLNAQTGSGDPTSGEGPTADRETILMESGSIRLDGDTCGECAVSRGMTAISTDGQEVGWVAAVALDAGGRPTGVVVARPQTTLQYHLIPLNLISRIDDGQVLLRVRAEVARSLPPRNGQSTPQGNGPEDGG